MNWISKNIFFGFVADAADDAVKFVSNQIINLFDKNVELITTKEIAAAVLVTTTEASVLLIIMTLKTRSKSVV